MPQDAVMFAERQASRCGKDFSALFLAFLREQFGYSGPQSKTVYTVTDEIGPITASLSGIAALPGNADDKDLLAAAVYEKYNSLP